MYVPWCPLEITGLFIIIVIVMVEVTRSRHFNSSCMLPYFILERLYY